MNFFIYGWMDRWVHYYFITMFAFDENCSIFIMLYLVVWNLNITVFLGLIVRGINQYASLSTTPYSNS